MRGERCPLTVHVRQYYYYHNNNYYHHCHDHHYHHYYYCHYHDYYCFGISDSCSVTFSLYWFTWGLRCFIQGWILSWDNNIFCFTLAYTWVFSSWDPGMKVVLPELNTSCPCLHKHCSHVELSSPADNFFSSRDDISLINMMSSGRISRKQQQENDQTRKLSCKLALTDSTAHRCEDHKFHWSLTHSSRTVYISLEVSMQVLISGKWWGAYSKEGVELRWCLLNNGNIV